MRCVVYHELCWPGGMWKSLVCSGVAVRGAVSKKKKKDRVRRWGLRTQTAKCLGRTCPTGSGLPEELDHGSPPPGGRSRFPGWLVGGKRGRHALSVLRMCVCVCVCSVLCSLRRIKTGVSGAHVCALLCVFFPGLSRGAWRAGLRSGPAGSVDFVFAVADGSARSLRLVRLKVFCLTD